MHNIVCATYFHKRIVTDACICVQNILSQREYCCLGDDTCVFFSNTVSNLSQGLGTTSKNERAKAVSNCNAPGEANEALIFVLRFVSFRLLGNLIIPPLHRLPSVTTATKEILHRFSFVASLMLHFLHGNGDDKNFPHRRKFL